MSRPLSDEVRTFISHADEWGVLTGSARFFEQWADRIASLEADAARATHLEQQLAALREECEGLRYDAETARLIEEHACDLVITPGSEEEGFGRLISVRPENALDFVDADEGEKLGVVVRAATEKGEGHG